MFKFFVAVRLILNSSIAINLKIIIEFCAGNRFFFLKAQIYRRVQTEKLAHNT